MATSKGRSRGQHQAPTVEDWLDTIRAHPDEYNADTDRTVEEAASRWGCSIDAAKLYMRRKKLKPIRVWHVQKEKLIYVYRQPAVPQPSAPSLSEVPADNDDAGKRRPTGKGVLRVSPKSRK